MTVATAVGEPQLLRAAARAASLDDRLRLAPPVAETPAAVVATRLSTWRQHAAGGEPARFAAYLAEAGLRADDATRLVHDVGDPAPEAVPPWVPTLADVVQRAHRGDEAGDAGGVAFGHLWVAAGATARHAILSALTHPQRSLLGRHALEEIVTILLRELAAIAAPTVYLTFSERRQQARRHGSVGDAYQRFIDDERGAGLPTLVTHFPVLGRLVAQRVAELAQSAVELITRLHADLPTLLATFGTGGDPGPVSSITFGWSDRHRTGRTVAKVVFERGMTLAYKPKPLDAEAALGSMAAVLAAAELAPPVVPHVMARDGYGWAGWIDPRPCDGPSDVARYFEAAGTLLALTSVLGGTDLLATNLVAAGAGPAVVDAEMLAVPQLAAPRLAAAEPPVPADAAVVADLQSSVVDTGLLPWFVGATPAEARDTSGLTGRHLEQAVAWCHLNTPDMILEPGLPILRRTANTVVSGGGVVDPADHVDELIEGCAAAHRWLAHHPADVAELVADSGLFASPARFTFRATATYELLARRAASPELLRDGLERSFALDAVNNTDWWTTKLARVHAEDPAAARQITAGERAALERLDIPLFVATPTDRDLSIEGTTVHGLFRGSPRDDLDHRLRTLDEDHLTRQVLAMRGCFEARNPTAPRRPRRPSAGRPTEALEPAARRIAELIAARAVRIDDSVSWLVVGENHVIRRHQLMPIGPDLYGGRAGLGVFLAAFAVHAGDDAFARLAGDCLRPLADFATRTPTGVGGALIGPASSAYGLALGAMLLGDEGLMSGARRAATAIAARVEASPDADERADTGDVASGLLGAALAMAAAAGHGAGPEAITAAGQLGQLGLTAEDPAGGDHPQTGVAHGLLGRALAFDRLHAVVGDRRFGDAADAAVEQADAALLAGDRPSGPLVDSWCQGRAGVAAAALSLGGRCASDSWRARVDVALAAARRPAEMTDASACCGRGGAVELLLLAGEEDGARTLAATMTATTHDDWLIGSQPGVAPLLLGFHRGLSGLGYLALRADAPCRFPSVLTWR
jgi:type 2 lantibiotic biosynthesis protein LanM